MKIRGFAGIRAFACLLVTLLGAAVSAFAQTHVANLTATNPTFLALDTRSGTTWLYVSEHGGTTGTPPSGGGRILRYNLTTGATSPEVVAARGSGDGQFYSPDGIVVDSATGDLFISDRYLNRIQRITPHAGGGNSLVMKWGSGTVGAPDEMHGPVGLAIDSSGAIYVAEHGDMNTSPAFGGGYVSKYTFTGSGSSAVATRAWRNGNGFNTPYGVAVSGTTLLISDGFNGKVQVWSTSGGPTGQFSTTGDIPLGLSIDASGALWIAESSNNGTGAVQQIDKVTIAGVPAGVSFGTNGSADGQFSLPFHAVLNSLTNRLYVADYGNNRVQVFDMATTPPPAAPSVTSSTSANATVGTAFTYNITASGTPTSYNATNLAGTGLSVNTSTGVISGTPTAAGTITSTISATNANGTGNATLTITVAASGGGGGGGGDTTAPTISSFNLDLATASTTHARYIVTFSENVTGVDAADFAANTQGTAGVSNIVVTGSGTTYHVDFDYTGSNGSIQMGIRTASTGITDAAGNAFVGGGVTASDTVSVNNAAAADMTIPTVSSFTVGSPSGSTVNFTVTFSEAVTGVTADDFFSTRTGSATATIGAVTGSGTTYTVPVTFSGTGTIQLTAVGGVTSNIRDAATNWYAGGGTSATFTIGSSGGGSAPAVTSATSASAAVGTAFTYTITGSNTPTSYNATNLTGTGLSVNTTTGVISGTPSAAGTITSTISATNANGTGNATLTITVAAASGGGSAPSITSSSSASATVGSSFSYSITASGSPTSYNATNLAGTGLSVNTSTGVISGTPSAAGTITSVVSATNANGTGTRTLTITVAAAGGGGTVPSITSASSAAGTVGSAFSYAITASGSPTSYAATNLSGTGLSLNTSTGVISGTPTAAGTINSTISATNSSGTGSHSLTITVVAAGAPPVITSAATASVAPGAAFSYSITATGSPTSYSATGLTGTGLSLNPTTGQISGTVAAAGTINATVSATNAAGTGSQSLTITIAPISSTAPSIVDQVMSGIAGKFVEYRVQASGNATFSLVPPSQLPPSLSMTTDGRIAGIPVSGGTFQVTVRATNSAGSAQAVVTINITQPPSTQPPSPPAKTSQTITFTSPVSAIRVGVPIQLGATTSSGLPITYTVVSGNATINGSTLTPTGTSTLIVRAAQAGNDTYAAASSDVNFGTPEKAAQTITFSAPKPAYITDSSVQLSATSSAGLPITYTLVSGPAILNGSKLTLTGDQGVIIVKASQAGSATVNAATDVSVLIPVWTAPGVKVMGLGSEVGADIVHQNGNVYDQVLMNGGYVSVTADPRQITRVSFIDLTDDIVQVEFSGAGTLSIVLDNPTGPAVATKYNQADVKYMKGHANISVTGADETTNLSVFSVGSATAVNQSLFPAGTTYDAMADIGLISISSTNGKFGGLRTANASYTGSAGMIGVSAPGVTFTGPVYIGDISAGANATGMIVVGSAPTLSITGGDLAQLNSRPIQVSGITNLTFAAGTKSNGVTQPAQTNKAQFENNGVDVTTQIIR